MKMIGPDCSKIGSQLYGDVEWISEIILRIILSVCDDIINETNNKHQFGEDFHTAFGLGLL
jgi:hypothetical protein